jgi:MtfA peptidase
MGIFEIICVLLFFIFFVGSLILFTLNILRFFFGIIITDKHGVSPLRYIDLKPLKLKENEKKVLEDIVVYYQNLPEKSKLIFENRVAKFILSKNFEAKQDLIITDEMKVLIAAGAIQVTFGLSNYLYDHFKTIIIYPKAYYSKITQQYHLGEVNARGIVVFSWEDVLKGFANPHDNLNVVIHEFAHALYLCFKARRLSDMNLSLYYPMWREEKEKKFFQMRGSNKNYLRQYAATNLMEFFAVAVENFFETPQKLHEELPGLYLALSKFLAQDPKKIIDR